MKTRKLLGFDLDDLIRESVKGLFEADQSQDDLKEKLAQAEASAASKERKDAQKKKRQLKDGTLDETDPSSDPGATRKPVTVKSDKLPDINVESIIDKLNIIRSGKSLKEKESKNNLKDYFQKLNGAERIALFAFLSGLAKVLGGEEGQDIKTPHHKPFNVDMEQEKKTKKAVKGSKTTGAEDSPIVVGESSNKRRILRKLRDYR